MATRTAKGRLSGKAWGCVFLAYLLSVAGLALAGWGATRAGFTIQYVTSDPIALMGQSLFVGIFSNLGMVVWAAAAAVCFFAALGRWQLHGRDAWAGYLAACGVVTSALLLDDLFMLHERVFPLHLNIHDNYVIGAYGLMLLAIGALFWRVILRTDVFLMALMFLFMAGSVAIDQVWHSHWANFFEDCLKFLGIVTWLAYFTHAGLTALRPSAETGPQAAPEPAPAPAARPAMTLRSASR